ncbi:MAG: DUF3109 family protein [Chitinophagaceae bacterium]
MIVIDNILVSQDVVEKQFVCDLSKCKGACCEDGDAGAPVTKEELNLINEYYEKVKSFMTKAAIEEVEKKGKYRYTKEYGWVTPTLPSDKEICVYGTRDENGVIKCSFEQAYYAGIIPWKKPISCHLYPIITTNGKPGGYEKVNYEPRKKTMQARLFLRAKIKGACL